MAITHGMNVEEVRALGHQLQQQAQHIHELVGQLEAAVNSANWVGPDSVTFKGTWWPEHSRMLRTSADQLHGFGQSALNNATEQEQVANH
jgi:uncharacterized protein YukE